METLTRNGLTFFLSFENMCYISPQEFFRVIENLNRTNEKGFKIREH